MTLHSLPVFLRLAGRPVILIGEGDAADAKRRLLERAGAIVVGETDQSALAIVALEDPDDTVARLKARGVLVNAVDRPDLCDFTLPAIVDRSPVIVAVGTGGASAGLAAALRQRLEGLLPSGLGQLAEALHAARAVIRERLPNGEDRRRAIGAALQEGGALDPLVAHPSPLGLEIVGAQVLDTVSDKPRAGKMARIALKSTDPDDLTLRQARALAQADRVLHTGDIPAAILDRARADAPRIVSLAPPVDPAEGLTVFVEMAR
jgi:uroporphyrin-III C-methyltransferase / precorrin-2 dehydrogenase / sirohydrochlorin ferrochelatase